MQKCIALTATADQNLIRLATRQLLDDLERNGTLSRHDVGVVKGMHERGACLEGNVIRNLITVICFSVVQNYMCSVGLGGCDLDSWCVRWHDYGGRDPQHLAC